MGLWIDLETTHALNKPAWLKVQTPTAKYAGNFIIFLDRLLHGVRSSLRAGD
jgi:hypothetical protein